ncbi:MAG: phenylalanine--tRNA ligase subunit beta [Bacteroidetes bacterium]|nr:phenylalanine--tRNA ligase subunit beta [Bacteroidota bacterium]
MKISYSWLKEYINIDLSPEKASEYLTDTGLEVEGLEQIDTIKGGLRGVVIGEVLSCKQHPNADRLKVTEVNIGSAEPVQIVCGAPNVGAGQKVLVATVGTEIYTEDGSFTIKKSKLRGETSEGMICAEDELGLGSGHDGIMILESSAEVGRAAAEHFGIESDYVIEIGLTPNRTDAMSHYGVARDLRAALLRFGASNIDLNLPSVSSYQEQNLDRPISVNIENTEACYRYMGISLSGVKVGESPAWMQNRLRAIGLNPVNTIVDIGNYVLHETGHPMHAFDADKIAGGSIVIKNAEPGQKFTTLDGSELELSDKDLMIWDAEKPLVLAGVYGGLNSGVSSETTNIFLEVAYFDPVHIRKSAKRHGLNTDSSFRYERGVDPAMTEYALKRAVTLIQELAGGEVSMALADEHPIKLGNHEVTMNLDRMKTLIGADIATEEVRSILASLDIRIKAEAGRNLHLEVPAYRQDVTREADIVEEVLRIYGFNAIPYDGPMRIAVASKDPSDDAIERELISSLLSAKGYHEMMNNSLTKSAYYEKHGFNSEVSVAMLNPLSQDLGVLRQSMLFGGLEALEYNSKRQRPNLKFYEFGRVYKQAENAYGESEKLSLWLSGLSEEENWRDGARPSSFYEIKNALTLCFDRLGMGPAQESATSDPIFSEGLHWHRGPKTIAQLGMVSKSILKEFDLKVPVYYAELNWSELVKAGRKKQIAMEDLPRFPEVRRDLALLVDSSILYADLEKAALRSGGKILKAVNLFDVYEGKNLPAGKKSYALSFTFAHAEKTLNDKEIEKLMAKILANLEKQCGASLR